MKYILTILLAICAFPRANLESLDPEINKLLINLSSIAVLIGDLLLKCPSASSAYITTGTYVFSLRPPCDYDHWTFGLTTYEANLKKTVGTCINGYPVPDNGEIPESDMLALMNTLKHAFASAAEAITSMKKKGKNTHEFEDIFAKSLNNFKGVETDDRIISLTQVLQAFIYYLQEYIHGKDPLAHIVEGVLKLPAWILGAGHGSWKWR